MQRDMNGMDRSESLLSSSVREEVRWRSDRGIGHGGYHRHSVVMAMLVVMLPEEEVAFFPGRSSSIRSVVEGIPPFSSSGL